MTETGEPRAVEVVYTLFSLCGVRVRRPSCNLSCPLLGRRDNELIDSFLSPARQLRSLYSSVKYLKQQSQDLRVAASKAQSEVAELWPGDIKTPHHVTPTTPRDTYIT